MAECIIAYRINDGKVEIVSDENDETRPHVFVDLAAADIYVDGNALFQSGQAKIQIIELDWLRL